MIGKVWRHWRLLVIVAALGAGAAAIACWLTATPVVTARRCEPTPTGRTGRLIVLVPALPHATSLWKDMRSALARGVPEYANAQWLCIDHHLSFRSRGWLADIAHSVRNRIDEEWAKAGGYDEIVLIGHSVGGLLVRQAYLLAAGADRTETVTVPWASHVRQIVLFAGVNRGVDVEAWGWHWRLLTWALEQIPVRFVSLDVTRGSQFIANLRINWMRYFRSLKPDRRPHIVQFLGDRDAIVKRDDSRDVLAFENGRYLEIAGATHGDLFRLEARYTDDPDGRIALILHGIRDRSWPTAAASAKAESPIKRVIFVLHGIRALTTDDWVSQLGTEFRGDPTDSAMAPVPSGDGATAVIHPEYGWLTAAKFAIPFYRHRYLAWFADRFAEAFAQHPRATFYAVAHSNGTYILGQNLLRLSGMEFDRVALAGSVLPVDFPWDTLRARQQVTAVRNYRATLDWPVALLCAGLRALGFRDVGTGGFEGFYGSTVDEVAYLKGGHGALFESESRRRHVVNFVLSGRDKPAAGLTKASSVHTLFRITSHAMPYVAWALVAGTVALAVWVWRGGPRRRQRLKWVAIALFVLYVILDIL